MMFLLALFILPVAAYGIANFQQAQFGMVRASPQSRPRPLSNLPLHVRPTLKWYEHALLV